LHFPSPLLSLVSPTPVPASVPVTSSDLFFHRPLLSLDLFCSILFPSRLPFRLQSLSNVSRVCRGVPPPPMQLGARLRPAITWSRVFPLLSSVDSLVLRSFFLCCFSLQGVFKSLFLLAFLDVTIKLFRTATSLRFFYDFSPQIPSVNFPPSSAALHVARPSSLSNLHGMAVLHFFFSEVPGPKPQRSCSRSRDFFFLYLHVFFILGAPPTFSLLLEGGASNAKILPSLLG